MDSVSKHDEFIEKFHTLGGRTYSEHYKNFYSYLKDLEKLPADTLNEFIINLKPNNTQEELFRAKILIKFNRHEELLNLLKVRKGLNKIVSRSPAFISYIIQLQPEGFITNVCPDISFVTRCHLVNKMAAALENGAAGDAYYDAFAAVYGHRNASPFLLSCSEGKLRQVITDTNYKLNERQLVSIHEKYPTFLKFYFEEQQRADKNCFENCKLLPWYLSIKDVATLKELLVYGKPLVGRRGLENYIKTYKDDIISNPREYERMLKTRTVYKTLSREDFVTLFKNLYPKRLEQCCVSNLQPYLMLLPFKDRGDVLASTYESVYGCRVYDNEDFKNDMLDWLPADHRVLFNLGEDQVEYMRCETSVKKLKQSIAFSSDQTTRKSLIEKLVNTCKHNRDSEAFLDVLKYYCSHHKNDTPQVRETFLRVVTDCIPALKLTEEHWKYIDDIVLTFEINEKCLPFNSYILLENGLQFKIINNMDYDAELKRMLHLHLTHYRWDMLRNYPKYERMCLLKLGELIPLAFEDEESRKTAHIDYLSTITYWNRRSRATINHYDYPEFIETLYEKVRDGFEYYGYIIDAILSTPASSDQIELRDKLIEAQLGSRSKDCANVICARLLKESHPVIETRMDVILDVEKLGLSHTFFYQLSKMHYNGFADLYRKKSLEIHNNPDSKTSQLKGALTFLSYGEDFLDIIEKYKPKTYVIDFNEPNMKHNLSLQKAILVSIKNYPTSTKCIAPVFEYCSKDYLQHALRSYCNVFYNTPQNIIKPLLKKASMDDTTEFAVNKLVVCLSTYLCPIAFSKEILKQCTKSPNTFMQKHAIKQMFNLFISDPTDSNRDYLLQSHFYKINENDKETVTMLCQIQKVPIRHLRVYIKKLWSLPSLKEGARLELLKSVRPDIAKLLDGDLWDSMVRVVIAKENQDDDWFIRNYLMDSVEKMPERFKLVFSEGIYKNSVKRANNLIMNLCKEFLKESTSQKLSNELLKNVEGLAMDYDVTPIRIMATCTHLCVTNENPHEILVKHFVDELKKCDVHARVVYWKQFQVVLEMLDFEDENNHHVIMCDYARAVMDINDSTDGRMFALYLLFEELSYNTPYNAKRKELIELIRKDAEPVVEMYLSSRLSVGCL